MERRDTTRTRRMALTRTISAEDPRVSILTSGEGCVGTRDCGCHMPTLLRKTISGAWAMVSIPATVSPSAHLATLTVLLTLV